MPSQRFLTVMNPASGRRRGAQVLARVRPTFLAAGAELDVQLCEFPGHARDMAKSHDMSAYDGICVIGGDGTVHEVADGLLHRNDAALPLLGIIPAGSGNTLLMQQGNCDPVAAARRIIAGRTSPLDVARVTMSDQIVHCINIVGWGAVAGINHLAEKLRFLGAMRYGVAALAYIVHPQPRLATVTLDGARCRDEFLFVIGCNTKYTGNGMLLAPRAETDDGKLDVVLVRRASRRDLLRLFTRVFKGRHVELDCVEYRQVSTFGVESNDCQLLNLDGELKGSPPIQVDMLPGALTIFSS